MQVNSDDGVQRWLLFAWNSLNVLECFPCWEHVTCNIQLSITIPVMPQDDVSVYDSASKPRISFREEVHQLIGV